MGDNPRTDFPEPIIIGFIVCQAGLYLELLFYYGLSPFLQTTLKVSKGIGGPF